MSYNFDFHDNQHSEASIDEGALLYRVASSNRCGKEELLKTYWKGKGKGRWHEAGKPTKGASYASNNVLIAISEVLYHMHRAMLDAIRTQNSDDILSAVERKAALAIMRMKKVEDLYYVNSALAKQKLCLELQGTAQIYSDTFYEPFYISANKIRRAKKSGVIYPSARHLSPVNDDFAVAFFDDKKVLIKEVLKKIPLKLTLVQEEQDTRIPPEHPKPFEGFVNQNIGFYEFEMTDPEFNELIRKSLLRPELPFIFPRRGYLSFMRQPSLRSTYPKEAVISC